MFAIDYALNGTGWATLSVTSDDGHVEMEVSYIGPDINDLVCETIKVLQERRSRQIVFETEPGEHVWLIQPEGDVVHLEIHSETSHLRNYERDEWAVVKWEWATTIPSAVFGQAVLETFERMITQFGVEGYKRQWLREPFALARLEKLRSLLS